MSLPKNMKPCPKHRMYPARFNKCPACHKDAVSEPLNLTEEDIQRATEISIARGDLHPGQVKGE